MDGKHSFLIWYSGDIDGVIINSENEILSFNDDVSILKYAKNLSMSVDLDDPAFHNLELIENWLKSSKIQELDCNEVLASWNLFDDIFRSINLEFSTKSKLENQVYDKLFWGNNLPAVTPKGKKYEPIWSKEEIQLVSEMLHKGFNKFKEVITFQH